MKRILILPSNRFLKGCTRCSVNLILCMVLLLSLAAGGCMSVKNPVSAPGVSEPAQTDIQASMKPTSSAASATALASSSSEVSPGTEASPDGVQSTQSPLPAIRTDNAAFSPNEMGKIPVVMFHRFVEAFEPKTEKSYTSTFQQFETLLETLHEKGFRLISMQDFLSGRISVPAGFKPMVFTFDDGTASQYSLEDAGGTLQIKTASAVGILRRFNEKHPDFGMKGIFFLNMDMRDNTFPGKGTLKERISLLLGLGFEVGNHTWGHVDFSAKGTRADMEAALGLNQKAMTAISPDTVFQALALPYGGRPKDKALRPYLASGIWEGTAYRNDGVFAVGAGPSVTVFDKRFDPLYIARVRATGKEPVEADLDWWLAEAGNRTFYVSDGNPDTLVIPEGQDTYLVPERAKGLKIIRYAPAP